MLVVAYRQLLGRWFRGSLERRGRTVALFLEELEGRALPSAPPMATQLAELTATDGMANSHFGTSVALDGNTAVIGVANFNAQNDTSTGPGAVYVFTGSGTTWTLQQKLTAADGATGDQFGDSVALSGNTLVVGAAAHGNGAGAAYVFTRSGTTWAQQQELIAGPGGLGPMGFGNSVALSGGTVVVGDSALVNGTAGSPQGGAFVFTQSGTTWTQQQLLTANQIGDTGYGGSVAISGSSIVVGAQAQGANFNQGAAYVYALSGTTWTQQAVLTAADGTAGDQFGGSVALSGTTAVIGATGHGNNGGAAYVFAQSGTTWTQQAELTAADGAAGDAFGSSVALSGTTVVVGAPAFNVFQLAAPPATNAGAAYIFTQSGTTWTQLQKLTAADGAVGDAFGNSVAVSGNTILVGANNKTVGSNAGQGAAYVFGLQTEAVSELGAYRASNGSWSLDSDGTPGFNAATDQVFFHFSPPKVTGVAGDWTGNGISDIGDFSNGTWHLDLNNNGVLDSDETFTFGQKGDKPVVGDWIGDGKSDLGVFRAAPDGFTGEFILDTNEDHMLDAGDATFTFGLATDRIVVGDWTGDGKSKVGVFRDAFAFNPADAGDAIFSLDTNNNHKFDTGDSVFVFGLITDGLVIGDWNGAGKSEVGVYRGGTAFGAPNTALFSLDTNGDLKFDAGDQVFLYGLITDQFVSGQWAKTPPLQSEGLPQAQFAANGPGPGGVAPLTEAQLEPVLQQAIAAWAANGANAAQLESVSVQIGTLGDNLVGVTSGNQITLDATADGWGWNIDTSSVAAGKMDLLTVVEHELGHELGLSDVDPATHPGDLMAATLPTGTRRTID